MDRKELIRAYKERRPDMGVYRIRNTVTGESLVAASPDVNSLLNRHKAQLRVGAHPSKSLQAAWKEHGPDSFTFEVLDILTPSDDAGYDPTGDLAALEELWLDKLGLAPDRLHTAIRKPRTR